jgi:hypothetical protein
MPAAKHPIIDPVHRRHGTRNPLVTGACPPGFWGIFSAMSSSAARPSAKLSQQVKSEAQRLGFELVGFSPVKAPPHEESFAQWLRRGFAGEMDYMKRTEPLRRDPRTLVPWAVSVISVGMNYFTPVTAVASFSGAAGMDLALRVGRRLPRYHQGKA